MPGRLRAQHAKEKQWQHTNAAFIGRKRFEVLSRLIHKAPELVDFLELVGRMTTNEEMGGDMSGDDACSTVSQIIETARGLFGIEVVEAEC